MTTLSIESIKDLIIHRYENLLLDTVTPDTNSTTQKGVLTLTISENDTLNRCIFLRAIDETKKVLLTPVFMEILALGAIISTGKIEEGQMAIFAGIHHFKKFKNIHANTPLFGYIEKTSNKSGFFKYKGTLKQNESLVAEGSITALYTSISKGENVEKPQKKTELIPKNKKELKVAWPENKNRYLRVVDTVVQVTNNSITSQYTYPSDHPFIKGHFPNNPIMMGVMQWTSIEDSIFAFCQLNKLSGNITVKANAQIIKKEGTFVAEMKSMLFNCHLSGSLFDYADTKEVKKITFRNMVKPSETLYICLVDIEII